MSLQVFLADGDGSPQIGWGAVPGALRRFEAVQADDAGLTYITSTTVGDVCAVKGNCLPAAPKVASVDYIAPLVIALAMSGFPGFTIRIYSAGGAFFEGPVIRPVGSYLTYDGLVNAAYQAQVDPATGKPWTYDAARAAQVAVYYSQGSGEIRVTRMLKKASVVYDSVLAATGYQP